MQQSLRLEIEGVADFEGCLKSNKYDRSIIIMLVGHLHGTYLVMTISTAAVISGDSFCNCFHSDHTNSLSA